MNDPYTHRSKPPSKKSCTNLASCIAATIFLLSSICIIIILYFLFFKPKPPKIAVDAVQFPTFSVTNSTVSFTYFQFVTVTNPNRDMFTHYDSSLQLVSGGEPVGVVFIPAGKIDGGRIQHMSAKFSVDGYPIPARTAARGGQTAVREGGVVAREDDAAAREDSMVARRGDMAVRGGEVVVREDGVAGRGVEVVAREDGMVAPPGGDIVAGGGALAAPPGGDMVAGGGEVGAAGGVGFGVGGVMEIETRMKLVGRVKVLKVFTHRVESRVKCAVTVELTRGSVLGLRC